MDKKRNKHKAEEKFFETNMVRVRVAGAEKRGLFGGKAIDGGPNARKVLVYKLAVLRPLRFSSSVQVPSRPVSPCCSLPLLLDALPGPCLPLEY
jgi:hypothetical protein